MLGQALLLHYLGERRPVPPREVRDELCVVPHHHLVACVAELLRDPPDLPEKLFIAGLAGRWIWPLAAAPLSPVSGRCPDNTRKAQRVPEETTCPGESGEYKACGARQAGQANFFPRCLLVQLEVQLELGFVQRGRPSDFEGTRRASRSAGPWNSGLHKRSKPAGVRCHPIKSRQIAMPMACIPANLDRRARWSPLMP